MINFYSLYNGTGLDMEKEYASSIMVLIKHIIHAGDLTTIKHIIKKSPRYAYEYACYVIRGRWKEAESVIMKDPQYACWYAINVMKCRWKEAEDIIKQDRFWWNDYKFYWEHGAC